MAEDEALDIRAEAARVFQSFDYDQSGKLETRELKIVMQHLEPEYWTDERVEILLQDLDVDGDQKLGFEEFLTWVLGEQDLAALAGAVSAANDEGGGFDALPVPAEEAPAEEAPAEEAPAEEAPAEETPAEETPAEEAPAEEAPAEEAPAEEAPAEEAPAEEAPAEENPAPAEETPAPVEETPAPAEEAPAPAEEAPAPVEEAPAPGEEETPVPVEKTPEQVAPTEETKAATEEIPPAAAPEETPPAAAESPASSPAEEAPAEPASPKKFQICCISATGLHNLDWFGKSDPYCVCFIKGSNEKKKTAVIDNNLKPVWNETFEFPYEKGAKLTLDVRDFDDFVKDELLGMVDLDLDAYCPGGHEGVFPLDHPEKKGNDGSITVKLTFS